MKEACLHKCKFIKEGICELYRTKLEIEDAPDPYDQGVVRTFVKCNDCMEKELSCSIDDKVREVYAFYEAYKQETDILFTELETLISKREDIYKEEK